MRLAGQDIGEGEIFTIRAGELGAPVGLVTGDQIVAEQLRKRAPWIEAVLVKQAFSNVAGQVIPPPRARELIRAGAERAGATRARRRARCLPLRACRPTRSRSSFETRCRDGMRANLARLPEFEISGEKTVSTVAEDMSIGFRRIAYLGYADREGVVRY